MNKTLRNVATQMLKDLLSQCTEGQIMIFKRMYSHDNLDLPINEVVDKMEDKKIDWALSQAENQVKKNKEEKKI